MIPILYQENETNFNTNGIGMLYDTVSYKVIEDRNASFELELEYPAGGRWASELSDLRLISAKPNDEDESHLFRIYEIVKNLEEQTITVYAASKSNDLGGNLVQKVSLTNVTPQQALTAMKADLVDPTSYNFISDIQTLKNVDWEHITPLTAILGTDNSLIKLWGGEVKRTNDTIFVYSRRGTDKVTTIRPGKGLDGFKMTTSTKGMITSILPFVKYTPKDSDTEVIVRGTRVNSPLINNYPVLCLAPIDYSYDRTLLPEGEMTQEQFNTALLANINAKASTYFTTQNPGCDKPKVTIDVTISQLSDSSEYEQFKKLEHIALTDSVIVWVEKYNVDVEVTINSVVYNGMSEMVESFKAGNAKTGLMDDVRKHYDNDMDKIKEYVSTVENGIYNTIRVTAEGKNNIFSGYTEPDESLVKEDDIWYKPVADGEIEMYRWTNGGWTLAVGNASKLAIGSIDANIINLVNLNASNISTGTITGANGGWDLNTGEFWLGSAGATGSGLYWNGSQLIIKISSGENLEDAIGDTVKSLDMEYYLSTSSTSPVGGTWQTIAPPWESNKFIFSRSKITYKDNSIEYKPNANGTNISGANGTSITKVDVMYYLSTSATALSDGVWTTIAPAWQNGKYMWSKTVTTYSNGTTTESTAACITGSQGTNGKGISSTVILYQVSSSGTTVPTGTWVTTIPAVPEGQYLWTKTTITYTDNGTSNLYSVGRMGTNGTNGKGISSTVVSYQAGSSGTVAPTGTWTTAVPSVSAGQYLWTRTITTYTDASTTTAYSIGAMGTNGTNGTNGRGISSTAVTYQAGSSGTVAPTGTWVTSIPSVSAGQYLWTKTVTTYTDATTSSAYSVGAMGTNGTNGTNGRGISSAVVTYQAGASGTTVPTGTWVANPPAVSASQYLWTRVITTYTDSTTMTAYSVGMMGAPGKGITSITEEYAISTSKTVAPTTFSTTRPTWTEGNYIWTRSKIVYNNPTSTEYTTAIPSTEWEAVNNLIPRFESNEAAITASNTAISLRALKTEVEGPIFKQNTAPAHVNGRLWLNTSVTPNQLKRSNGSAWINVTPTSGTEIGLSNSQIAQIVESTSEVLAKKADITLVDDEWKARFQANGGKNAVRNGNFANGTKWFNTYWCTDASYWLAHQNNEWTGYENAIEIGKGIASGGYIVVQVLEGLVPGRTYTIACLAAAHRGSAHITIINQADNLVVGHSNVVGDDKLGGSDINNWGTIKLTFVATDSIMHLRLNLTSSGANTYNWYKRIRCYEGDSILPYAPNSSELYDGVTKIDKDGVNVSRSDSDINTQLSHSGIEVRDGANSIAAFGDAGAYVPSLKSNVPNISSFKGGEIGVGPGRQFSTISQALEYLFPGNTKYYMGGDIHIRVYGSVNEDVVIVGLQGSGRLIIYLHNITFSGTFQIFGCTLPTYIVNGDGGSVVKNPGTVSGYMFTIKACRYVQVSGLRLDNNGGYYAFDIDWGAHVQINNCDVVRANYMILGNNASFITMFANRGNLVSGILRLLEGAKVFLSGTRPVGYLEYSTNKFIIYDGSVTELASAYSPPPITSQTFTQTFTAATFDTLVYGSTSVDNYYGATAAQNRWDSSMGWKQGRIRMGAEVYNFYNGGSAITVKVRLRRKNTSHGNSGAVLPAGIGTFATGALRGGWTSWATVSASLFGSGGADLRLYNGVTGANGYAIWDAIEVEVTVTKNI